MNSTKKGFLAVTVAMLFSVLIAGSALASQYGTGDLTNLTTYLTSNGLNGSGPTPDYVHFSNSGVSGTYWFTPLAYEAAYKDELRDGTTVLFTNTSLPTEFGTSKLSNSATTNFYDTTGSGTQYNLGNSNAVEIFKLLKDWTVGGVTLASGTLILGLNDSAGTSSCGNNGDFDDFIVAASNTKPTPLPAAVWLLGSGLLGLMGFKRGRQKA